MAHIIIVEQQEVVTYVSPVEAYFPGTRCPPKSEVSLPIPTKHYGCMCYPGRSFGLG